MILVDTSVWIANFQGDKSAQKLHEVLNAKEVIGHDWIFGEMMVGDLGPSRDRLLADYRKLPHAGVYSIQELFDFIERRGLKGSGLSLVDMQLLYVCIRESHELWTLDRMLAKLSQRFSVSFSR